jgi:hypothetical protein
MHLKFGADHFRLFSNLRRTPRELNNNYQNLPPIWSHTPSPVRLIEVSHDHAHVLVAQ